MILDSITLKKFGEERFENECIQMLIRNLFISVGFERLWAALIIIIFRETHSFNIYACMLSDFIGFNQIESDGLVWFSITDIL